MPTSLATQLAHLRAHGDNALDLQAQRKAHSKSLLFEPQHAATQDFDMVFQVCFEGFQDLCQLDPRFTQFAQSLFSEQSKYEERAQMTATQNHQLNVVLEDFMTLVGSKLSLRPALKAMEWLVRRFRVHKYNLACLLMTFLPYYSSPTFRTVLSILPETMDPTFRFIQPCVKSLTNPSRHSITETAATNRSFFRLFNIYVFDVCRKEYQYPALLSFWSSIASEAVASMLDRSRTGRKELQRKNQDDIKLLVLPLLSDALLLRHAVDLKVGCYMILAVLSSKAQLEEDVLISLMDTVASGWDLTVPAGLICIAVLAQQRRAVRLPGKILYTLLAVGGLSDELILLSQKYKVEKLVLGLILGINQRLEKLQDIKYVSLIRILLEADLMQPSYVAIAVKSVVWTTKATQPTQRPLENSSLHGALSDLLLSLADSSAIGHVVRDLFQKIGPEMQQMNNKAPEAIGAEEENLEVAAGDEQMHDVNQIQKSESFDALLHQIPTRTASEISFLSHTKSVVFQSLSKIFLAASLSSINVGRCTDLPVLRKSLAMTDPLYFSFFIRIWCGSYPEKARAAAIIAVQNHFKEGEIVSDLQVFLPYLLYALGDPSSYVRRAAAHLVLALAPFYQKIDSVGHDQSPSVVLGQDQIYGQGAESEKICWLPIHLVAKFLEEWLVPSLEECRLDPSHILSCMRDRLNGSSEAIALEHGQSKSSAYMRSSILKSLCSHISSTPLHSVRFRLLPVLSQINKIGNISGSKLLLPLLESGLAHDERLLMTTCEKEHLDTLQYLESMMTIVTPKNKESVRMMETFICSKESRTSPMLCTAFYQRLGKIWLSLNPQRQVALAEQMLELAGLNLDGSLDHTNQDEALQTLRSLKLPIYVLSKFCEDFHTFAIIGPERGSKRRRVQKAKGEISRVEDEQILKDNVKRSTLVLELIESSNAERDPELVGPLFKILADLHSYQNQNRVEVDYLKLLVVSSLLMIIEHAPVHHINKSFIRADVLIDCIRTTKNTQVQRNILLLISVLANVTPEIILHNVMPIFTFMSESVLRLEDSYSAHVAQQTIDSVIPQIMESSRRRKENPIAGISELLLTFVAAFEHIPAHRRVKLFRSLIDKIGAEDSLFALSLLLQERYPQNEAVHFVLEVGDYFGARIQLQTIAKYLDVVLATQKPDSDRSIIHLISDSSTKALVNLISYPILAMSDERLKSKVAEVAVRRDAWAQDLQSTYARVMEQTFALPQILQGATEWETKYTGMFEALLSLLPMPQFIITVQILLSHAEAKIRYEGMRMFEIRLGRIRSERSTIQTACLSLLPQLSSIVECSLDQSMKRLGIICIEQILVKFGKTDVDTVIKTTELISSANCLDANNLEISSTAMVALSTVVGILIDEFACFLPSTLPRATTLWTTTIEKGICTSPLNNAAHSFFGAVLLYVPWAVSDSNLDLLLKAMHVSAKVQIDEVYSSARRATLDLIAKQIDPKKCCASLERTWSSAIAKAPLALKEHLQTMTELTNRQPKSSVVHLSETLARLLMKAFDVRRVQFCPPTDDSYDNRDVEDIEDKANNLAITMIYKLSDSAFRPIFVSFLRWAVNPDSLSGEGRVQRQRSLYKFLACFFDQLKSLVTSYAAFIIDDSVKILESLTTGSKEEQVLGTTVLLTLQKSFENDQDDFWRSPSNFTPVSESLVSQLGQTMESSVASDLITTITALAVAADSAAHHKDMNSAILKHLRSDDVSIRLAALRCQQKLTARLGEEWLGLLPEMLPIINELQEDEDETVERETLEWIASIEEILGESLGPMLR